MKKILGAALLSAAVLMTSGCGPKDQLRVKDAVVKLSPVDANPAVLHFDVYGGQSDVRLLTAYSSSAIRTELHETRMDPDTKMMSMVKLKEVPVPAGEKVEFKKGGLHGMVFGVNNIARRTGEMDFIFTFSNSDRIKVTAAVQEADGSMPDEHKKLME